MTLQSFPLGEEADEILKGDDLSTVLWQGAAKFPGLPSPAVGYIKQIYCCLQHLSV